MKESFIAEDSPPLSIENYTFLTHSTAASERLGAATALEYSACRKL
jgi:hypothetical protein